METFQYIHALSISGAVAAARNASTAQHPKSVQFIAGGTTLVDLLKLDVVRPATVIDINQLPLHDVVTQSDGGLLIGALVRNSDLANDPRVIQGYPALSQALLSGASAQLRNKATTAGNLLQRTRCMYFRDVAQPCNKRLPGSGCGAIGGANRMMAVFGTSAQCIASHPSDMCVALAALDAVVHLVGPEGGRLVKIEDFHLLPENAPDRENILLPGELVTHVSLPPPVKRSRSTYLKLRDRASYEFALVSAATVLGVKAGRIDYARLAMGGVATKPWRLPRAEQLLIGQIPTESAFQQAAEAAFEGAQAQSENGFKIDLGRRCLVHALNLTSGLPEERL